MAEDSGQPQEMQLNSGYIRDLSGQKQTQAEEAKQAAVEILKDALEKGMYGFPVSFHYTCSEPVDPYKFCCIPTQTFLRDLLETMQKVVFKEDEDPEESYTFAYVCPREDSSPTVYLCKAFWDAPDHLCIDSKPGTLIHEVSHLLGTEDVYYELMVVELYENYGTLLGRSCCVQGEDGAWHYREEVAQINANSLEHEFETVLNHNGEYRNGKHSCCGETKKHSVCRWRETAHYHLHERFNHHKVERKLCKKHPTEVRKYTKIKNRACRTS
ncbi:hypothetical protein AAFF_G00098680 [Aldrovandia affinis]|uniref:Lysine-specific metallo-endopeptidase domain-containing protein n=1 Tax=Aldrovandia affinis TaxID=143900 RepID=A0AAD7RVH3_9TELE|nr:hypothetical protein AAFF_G00098680 [Aldrovandia affinis]